MSKDDKKAKKKIYLISQTLTYQIEINAYSEVEALKTAGFFDPDRWELVDCSDREVTEL
jgi:hypothetical protein